MSLTGVSPCLAASADLVKQLTSLPGEPHPQDSGSSFSQQSLVSPSEGAGGVEVSGSLSPASHAAGPQESHLVSGLYFEGPVGDIWLGFGVLYWYKLNVVHINTLVKVK